MTKEQYILELIREGKTDLEISKLVNENYPDIDPAPSTSIAPQQALDRVVAAIKKVKETSGGEKTWKDITATYQSRVWTAEDVGKLVRITSLGKHMLLVASLFEGNKMLFSSTMTIANAATDLNLITGHFIFSPTSVVSKPNVLYETITTINNVAKNIATSTQKEATITKFEIFE